MGMGNSEMVVIKITRDESFLAVRTGEGEDERKWFFFLK
jgi:hypothetical protein